MNIRNLLKWTLILAAFLAYREMDIALSPDSSEIEYISTHHDRGSSRD